MKKVAIVGVEGSGKTVMLAGLGELYTYPDEDGYFLAPKNFGTAAYVAEKMQRMRKGEWPSATAGDEMQGLDWTLKRREPGVKGRPKTICEVSFLDFAGEVYRAAYGISGSGDALLKEQVKELQQYVRGADDLIVLINLRDVITNGLRDERVQEAMWITKSILDTAFGDDAGKDAPHAAIVLSQADSYASTIEACGGARGVLHRYLPHVAAEYDWLDVFTANAVDKTVLDDGGNMVPAADFTAQGLLPILQWIRGENVSGGGRDVAVKKAASRTGGARLSRPSEPSDGHKAGDVMTITLPGGAEMRMRWCPPGSFMMGSPKSEESREEDEQQHRVKLTKGFWLGETPVTQRQWQSVMGDNPSCFDGVDETEVGILFWKKTIITNYDSSSHPVDSVTWNDCQKFIKKVNEVLACGARLPTEAEWEYACRAGTTSVFSWGNALNGDKANCDGSILPYGTDEEGRYLEKTTPVGRYGGNAWGLCDMHGNVWEWCADRYGAYPTGTVTDPQGPHSGSRRVLRGGSWATCADSCRSASRNYGTTGSCEWENGFRLCCSSEPHERIA